MPGKRRRVIGQLRPDCLYTREGAMRYAGLGLRTLRAMEAAGLPSIERQRLMYYRGRDLIAAIESNLAADRKLAAK